MTAANKSPVNTMKDKKVAIGLPETVPIPRKKLPGRMKRRAQSTEKMLTRRLAMKAFPYCVNPAKIVRTEKGSFLRILRDRPDKDTLKAPAVRKVYNASAEAMRPNVVMPAAGEVCIDVSMSEIISEVALPSDASMLFS